MDSFSYYEGTTEHFAAFMEVSPRPATPDEALLYDGNLTIYEVEVDEDQKLKAVHSQLVEGGDEYITVEMRNKGRLVFSQSLSCVRYFVDKMDSGEVFLVISEGSTNLHIHKNPWRLHVDNSTYHPDAYLNDY